MTILLCFTVALSSVSLFACSSENGTQNNNPSANVANKAYIGEYKGNENVYNVNGELHITYKEGLTFSPEDFKMVEFDTVSVS